MLKNMELSWLISEINFPSLLDVVVSQRLIVSQELHERCDLHFPMIYTCEPIYIGKTSYGQCLRLTEETTNKTLLELQRGMVLIHPLSRTVAQIPNEYKLKLQQFVSLQKPERIFFPEKPQNVHVCDIMASYSDLDMFGHVMQSAYIRFCLNAICDGYAKNFFQSTKYGPENCKVQFIDAIFIKESKEYQKMKVLMWMQSDKNEVFWCYIDNKNNETVFKAKIVFYTQ